MPGIDESYVSPAEWEMIKALRQEKEIIVNEQNEKSSNQRAVEDIERLKEYLELSGINFCPDPVDNAINCLIHRLGLLKVANVNDLNEYQNAASKTAIYPGKGTPLGLIYCALKLSGEAGEVAENVGKALRDDGLAGYMTYPNFHEIVTEQRLSKLKLELGDVLWYISQAAKELGFTLEEIAQANLDKLSARAKNGTLKGSGDDR